MPIPLLAWAGVVVGTAVVSAVAYGVSQWDAADDTSSHHDEDAQRRLQDAQAAQIRQEIQAEADAWLRSQQITLSADNYERLLHQLQTGATMDARLWKVLERASPAIAQAEATKIAEAQCIAEYEALLEDLRGHIHATH
jgi:hypothetical protein